jgi:hypothetical protein
MPSQPVESPARATLQGSGSAENQLALPAPLQRNSAGFGGHTLGHSAGASRALLTGCHSGDLLALSAGGGAGCGRKGGSFTNWTQTDPN